MVAGPPGTLEPGMVGPEVISGNSPASPCGTDAGHFAGGLMGQVILDRASFEWDGCADPVKPEAAGSSARRRRLTTALTAPAGKQAAGGPDILRGIVTITLKSRAALRCISGEGTPPAPH